MIRENSDMILSDNENEDMESLNETIFENIKRMMSGSGTEVEKEDVDNLLEQATAANKEDRAETQETPKALSAVELAKAAQKAAKPDPKEVKETKSAVEMAKEAQLKEQAKKTPEEEKDSEESIEDLLNDDFDDLEIEENQNEEQTSAVPEKMDAEESESSSEEVQSEEVSEETSDELMESDTEESPPEVSEESKLSENQKDSQEDEEEYEYVDPDELVLGNHTQAEIDEAMENLASLGLEGDVYERAKRMLLLELAGSEAVLDAWLKEQEGNKKKKAAVSALDGEDNLGDLSDFDEEALEKELELAMDEDFLMEDEEKDESSKDSEDNAEEEENEEEEFDESDNVETEEFDENDSIETDEVEESESEEQPESSEVKVDEHTEPDIEVEEVIPTPKEKKERAASGKSAKQPKNKKKVVRRKEKPAPEPKKEKEVPNQTEAEEKGYQVSVRKPFVLKNSASFMNQFEEYIVDTQENRKLSTGFKKLDAMLRYGLHKGSYFIDSQPQYLKNSFMQQIADRAAEAGIDVLYISTELSRYDLMVDTISRLSYEIHQGDLNKAVSVMSIMTGEDGADIGSLKDELNWYRGRISEHLFILDQEAVSDYVESMEEASAGEILEELIRSIVREGAHKPVVFIDNIENILSVEDSEDMKPLMDGIRKLSKELGIPIVMSYGYAQAESEEELNLAEIEFHESIGNMCDVYLELKYADMITEDSVELTEEDIRDMVEEGDTLLIDVLLHRNRRPMKASCQIQGTPKYNYFEE